jgi:hypothetical protein
MPPRCGDAVLLSDITNSPIAHHDRNDDCHTPEPCLSDITALHTKSFLSDPLVREGRSLVEKACQTLDFACVELNALPKFLLRVRKERLRFRQPRVNFSRTPEPLPPALCKSAGSENKGRPSFD